MRIARFVLLVAVLIAGAAFWWASRAPVPVIDITTPAALIGQNSTLTVQIDASSGRLSALDVSVEQAGTTTPLFALPGNDQTTVTQVDAQRVRLTRPIGAKAVPTLKEGKATVRVFVEQAVMLGLSSKSAAISKEFEVRLTPPRLAVVSQFHFVNHGGSEMAVYRVTPADAETGVKVGDALYRGYPASAAGVERADPSLKVAFFALLHDQDLKTPVFVQATDAAGNEARAAVDVRVFPKPFRKSRIEVDDGFLARVVPAIQHNSPDFTFKDPSDLVGSYLAINREMRRKNDAFIAELATKTAPARLWEGAFKQLTNSQVEASFADHRTYFHGGQEIDRQVHLGFDLAVTAGVSVTSANRGVVVWAGYLGIYGNCVIVDHGMGVQSLYAHLSSIEVAEGAKVARDEVLGRSGMTGLAGGDHLHFTMLVGGHAVNPVDWWSAQWVEDRLLRKLREAQGGGL